MNFATRRLLKDYYQILNEKIPTVGVVAEPFPDNFFKWACNIKGPKGTLYEGGVFHLILNFPETYPHHPPMVKLMTPFPHPNVFGNFICLDMLIPERNGN